MAAWAKHVVHPGKPAPSPKSAVGGRTTILNAPSWRKCSNIDALEYRDESVAPPTTTHDEPLVRLSIRNGLPIPRSLALTARAPHSATTTMPLSLGPSATATVTLPCAFSYENGSSYGGEEVCIFEEHPPADPSRPARERLNLVGGMDGYSLVKSYKTDPDENIVMLLSSGIRRDDVTFAFTHDVHTVELRREPADWPRDFRAYLPFDAVCIRRNVRDALPAEARAALRAFEVLGGAVVVVGDGESIPKNLHEIAAGAQRRRVGDLSVRQYYYSYSRDSKFSEHQKRVPITVSASIPVGFLSLLLLLVALVVMPGIVIFCVKRNKRLLPLAALPCAAFALTLLVALIALLTYGTTPTVRVQAVTILDPESRLAVTRGQFAVFAPGEVTDEMSIPGDVSFRLRSRSSQDTLSATYGAAFRLGGPWIKPLSAAFMDFERAERRSERLDVKPLADGRVAVANLLGVPVAGGIVQSRGRRHKLPALAPGEQTTVSPMVPANPSTANVLLRPEEAFFEKGGQYGRGWPELTKMATTSLILPDGAYVVQLDGSPFLPSPLAGRKTYGKSEAIVAGYFTDKAEGGKEATK